MCVGWSDFFRSGTCGLFIGMWYGSVSFGQGFVGFGKGLVEFGKGVVEFNRVW